MGGKTIHNVDERVAGFKINSATYGLVQPVIFGTARISGNVIDYIDFKAIPHTETQSSGKGGTKVKNTTWSYTAAVILGLAEGPVGNVLKVWVGSDATYDNVAAIGLTLFNGTVGQQPWSYMVTKHPERALPYSGLAYVAGVMDLTSHGSLPELNFELQGLLRDTGDGVDANPADVIEYIVNDVNYGGKINAESLQRFKDFCYAADLLVSMPLTDTRKAYEIVNAICQATNTYIFSSQDEIKLVPQCYDELERNGVTYTPITSPYYNLTADDFMDDNPMVEWNRKDSAKTYNHVPVKFTNRDNGYEQETAEWKIEVDINNRGLRSMKEQNIDFIYKKERAVYIARMKAIDGLYGSNQYRFRLGWKHCLLEPGDFVTIYDPVISSEAIPVIIEEVDEDEDGELRITAKRRPPGTFGKAVYTFDADRYMIDRNAAPGNVNPPVIFEAPKELTTANQPEIWMAISGAGEYWGGCEIWVSDDDLTYKYLGTINGPARTGALTADLPLGDSPDTVNTLSVDMTESKAELLSGTQADAEHLNTLCYVDGEFMAYQTATLTGEREYDLDYLVRGAYHSPVSDHVSGTKFARIDESVFKMPYTEDDIGRTFYLKFLSFNVWGFGKQTLENVSGQSYVVVPGAPPRIESYSVESTTDGLVVSIDEYDKPIDFKQFEVHISETPDFIPTGWDGETWNGTPNTPATWNGVENTLHTITSSNPMLIAELESLKTYYITVVAVDKMNQRSIPSPEMSATTENIVVKRENYEPGSVPQEAIEPQITDFWAQIADNRIIEGIEPQLSEIEHKLYPTEDAYVGTFAGDAANYGAVDHLKIGSYSHSPYSGTFFITELYGLLKFDLSGISGEAYDVSFEATCSGYSRSASSPASKTLRLRTINGAWQEMQVTSLNRPGHGSENLKAISNADKPNTYSFASAELTSLVNGWIAGTTQNDGLHLGAYPITTFATRQYEYWYFRSREYESSTYRPCLTFKTEVSPGLYVNLTKGIIKTRGLIYHIEPAVVPIPANATKFVVLVVGNDGSYEYAVRDNTILADGEILICKTISNATQVATVDYSYAIGRRSGVPGSESDNSVYVDSMGWRTILNGAYLEFMHNLGTGLKDITILYRPNSSSEAYLIQHQGAGISVGDNGVRLKIQNNTGSSGQFYVKIKAY